MVAVVDAKLTGRPDEAVAETGNGGAPMIWFFAGANVMVCGSFVTWNAWVTGVAVQTALVETIRLQIRAQTLDTKGRWVTKDRRPDL